MDNWMNWITNKPCQINIVGKGQAALLSVQSHLQRITTAHIMSTFVRMSRLPGWCRHHPIQQALRRGRSRPRPLEGGTFRRPRVAAGTKGPVYRSGSDLGSSGIV